MIYGTNSLKQMTAQKQLSRGTEEETQIEFNFHVFHAYKHISIDFSTSIISIINNVVRVCCL